MVDKKPLTANAAQKQGVQRLRRQEFASNSKHITNAASHEVYKLQAMHAIID